MSTKLVVNCDHEKGCLENFDAFNPEITERKMNKILRETGWSIVEDEVFSVNHFCPKHTSKEQEKENE